MPRGPLPTVSPYPAPAASLTRNSAASSLCRNSHWGALFAACPSFLCQNVGNSNNTSTENHPKSYTPFLRYCACPSVVRILLPGLQDLAAILFITVARGGKEIHYTVKGVNIARKPVNRRKVESACFLV